MDKIKGLIFGAAIGDALGFIAEYQSRDLLEKYIQELKGGELKTLTSRTYPKTYPYGQYSDDTQFSTLLLENILNNKTVDKAKYLQILKEEFLKNNLVGLGSNTKKILSGTSNKVNNSSNGSIIRTYPVGLLIPNSSDFKECLYNSLYLGGDTDSVASLACGLKGLKLGFNSIPKEFQNIPYDQENKVTYLNKLSERVSEYLKSNP